ncbi:MAG: hypothetical protein U0R19_35335 [Bryobacteraceae bacterium]
MMEDLNLLSITREEPGKSPSDGATGTYEQPAARFENPIWQLGFTDGRLGTPQKTIEELMKHWEEKVKETSIATDDDSSGTTPREREAAHADQLVEIRRSAEVRYMNSPHLISPTLATMELVFGLMLLAGDIGLNWSVLGEAFGLAKDFFMRAFLCAGIVAVAGIAMPFFEEWVFRSRNDQPRRIATMILLGLMMVMAVVVAAVRTGEIRESARIQQERREFQNSAGSSPSPGKVTVLSQQDIYLMGIAYGVMSMVFALSSGFFLSLGVHRLSERSKYRRIVDSAPTVNDRPSPGETVLQLPIRRLDIDAKDIIHSLGIVYRHGYERGAAVRWTLREGDSVYAHCLRVVRNRSVTAGL